MRPFTRIGKTVSRYTRSPSAECLVLTLLMRLKGTFVPVSTVNGVVCAEAACGAGAGCVSCAQSSPEATKVIANKGRRNIGYSIPILLYWLNAPRGRKVAAG